MASSKFFIFLLIFTSFFLISTNQVHAALPYSYIGPVRCSWSFEKIDTDKVNPVLELSVGKGTRDYTATETLVYAGTMVATAIPAVSLMSKAVTIGTYSMPFMGTNVMGWWPAEIALSISPAQTVPVGVVGWGAAEIALSISPIIMAVQLAPIVGTIYTWTLSMGVEPPRELGPVQAIVTIYVDGNKFQESSAFFGSFPFPRIKIPYTLDSTSKHNIRAHITRVGGENIYEKSGLGFYTEVNNWDCSFEWDPSNLGELVKEELCKTAGLHIEGKWINSQQMELNVTSSSYCSGFTVDIIGCGYRLGTLDNEGKATFVLEGCKNGEEVYAELPYPNVKSNSITIHYPDSYITDERREGDELKVRPTDADRFTQSNYPESCWTGDEPQAPKGIVRIVVVEGDELSERVILGPKIAGVHVAVYDKSKIVCEGYSDENGVISCEKFDCFDRIVVGGGKEDYEIVGYRVDFYTHPPGIVETGHYTLYITLKKKVKGYVFRVWVRGRTGEHSNGIPGAVAILIPKTGQFKEASAITDAGGIATFTTATEVARLIVMAKGYKTYDEEINVLSIIEDPYFVYRYYGYEIWLEPGESSGCAVISDKQLVGCGDVVNVNVFCYGECSRSYTINCGNGDKTEVNYCGNGLCGTPGQCKYECGDKYKVGDTFTLSTSSCQNTSIIIESMKEKFITSSSPYQKIFVRPSTDITFTVITSKEAKCEFKSSIIGGSPDTSYSGIFDSSDGKTHTYKFSIDLIKHDGLYSFSVTCYEKNTNAVDTTTISFTVMKYGDEFVKNLATPIDIKVCTYDTTGKPVSGTIVLINVVGLSLGQYHHPPPASTGSNGCAVLSFLAPKYKDGGFKLLVCLGMPKGDGKYLDQQCKEIEWSYPPRPLIVKFSVKDGVENIQDLKYMECDGKQLKIRVDPPGPFFIPDCIEYPSFNVRVIAEGVCSLGDEKYSDPYAFAVVRGAVVSKDKGCPSDEESYTSLFPLYGIRSGSSLSHYLSSLSTPCEDGDYLICLIANDTLGIYNSTSASTLLHVGELKDCRISMSASCQNSGAIFTGALYRADVDVKIKVENCVKGYDIVVRHSSPNLACCPILDYCGETYQGTTRQIYDVDAYEYITFPGTVSEEFECSSGWGVAQEGYTLHLNVNSVEKTSLTLNCTEKDSKEVTISPST